MKQYFLLFTLVYLFNSHVLAMEKSNIVALSSVGLLSGGILCALEGISLHMESRYIRDLNQKRAVTRCGNEWLKGALLTGLTGAALLSKVAAEKRQPTQVAVFAFASSVMFGFSGSLLLYADECHDEFVRKDNQSLAVKRDKAKYMAALCAAGGCILSLPVILSD